MDPAAADPSCIIQALPAHSNMALPPPPLVQALPAHQSPAKPHPPPAASPSASPKRRPPPPSPRRTRSGGAPEWTAAETLALVAEVAAVDDGWSRSISAFQKWAMVAENLAASSASGPARRRGSKRAAAECRRRWEALAAEYGAVRRWEVRTGGRYWEMRAAERREAGLPVEFDAEVYGVMDALIRVEEALLAGAAGGGAGGEEVEGLVGDGAGVEVGQQDGGHDVGKEEVKEDGTVEEAEGENKEGEEVEEAEGENEEGEEVEEEAEEENEEGGNEEEEQEELQVDGGNADASDDLEGHQIVTNSEPDKSQNDAWELANKLQENAQHIHTILSEEADEDAGKYSSLAGAVSPDVMETTRQKADELIKSLGGLVSYMNQFTELVKENGFENMVGMT